MKFDDNQFEALLQKLDKQTSWIDLLGKIVPIIAVLLLGIWTLIEYRTFTHDNQNLQNEKMRGELLEMEVARAKVENENKLHELKLELAQKRNLSRETHLHISEIKKDGDDFIYKVDYSIVLKNHSQKKLTVTYNMFAPFFGCHRSL